MNQKLLSVAKGETPADLVIRNGKVVNVYSGEIYDGGVAICGDTIAAVGDVEYCIGEGTRVVDAEGKYLTPGFLDGHIHPESSSLAIRPFAEAVLAHGTTGIMTDLHEVGVVSGLEGIEAILKEAEATDLKIYFVVPSHVPFSPNLETSGGRFNPYWAEKIPIFIDIPTFLRMSQLDLARALTENIVKNGYFQDIATGRNAAFMTGRSS